MSVDVVTLDPDAGDFEDRLALWHAVYRRVAVYGRPATANPWALDTLRARLANNRPDLRFDAQVAFVAGEPVGCGIFEVSLLDNLTAAVVFPMVLPAHRRRGIGTALLAAQTDLAVSLERTVLHADVHEGPGEGGEDLGGLAFALAHRFDVELVGLQSRLRLPVDAARLDALATAAAPHHQAYGFRTFEGAVPDDIVASYAALEALVDVESPTGGLEIEPNNADVATWRAKESELAASGKRRISTAAIGPDGEVVAMTDLIARDGDTTIHQDGTIVRHDHRGHRLGIAVKVANLRCAARHWPHAREVVTWNAEDNAPMLAVNADLGFRVVERSLDLQRRL